MKIAISTDGDIVSAHFGRCPSFTIVNIEEGKVVNKDVVDNPGHQPGALPKFLHEKGVDSIVAGGMGMNAVNLFNQFGIEAVVGVAGKIDDVVEHLAKGTLTGGESLCNPDAGKGYGVEKSACDNPDEEDCHH